MKGIADTGLLVAFVNRRDAYHDWAISLERQMTGPLLTCEAVLAEAAFHVQDARISVAPAGARRVLRDRPTAHAVGYHLSPLRG